MLSCNNWNHFEAKNYSTEVTKLSEEEISYLKVSEIEPNVREINLGDCMGMVDITSDEVDWMNHDENCSCLGCIYWELVHPKKKDEVEEWVRVELEER